MVAEQLACRRSRLEAIQAILLRCFSPPKIINEYRQLVRKCRQNAWGQPCNGLESYPSGNRNTASPNILWKLGQALAE